MEGFNPDNKAKVSKFDKGCLSLATVIIQIFNLIDFVLGCALLAFTVYFYEIVGETSFLNPHAAWAGWCCGCLGILLLFMSFMSLIGISSPGCRWAIVPTKTLSLIVTGFDIGLGAAFILKKKDFLDYVDSINGVTDKDMNILKSWYVVLNYAFFAMAVLEIVRYILSRHYREDAIRVDGEFAALLTEDDNMWRQRLATNQAAREDKYNDLRNYYKNKYARNNA